MRSKDGSFDYQVLNLTQKFYADYPDPPYKEIVRKGSRPYSCLLLQSHYGYYICIPFRSHINHIYAYKFRNSMRSKRVRSGLDFSKIIIIRNGEYIGTKDVIVDKDEFNEMRDNIEYIKNDSQRYIDDYIDFLSGKRIKYSEKEFARAYKYSTLKYFHKELGIAAADEINAYGRCAFPVEKRDGV